MIATQCDNRDNRDNRDRPCCRGVSRCVAIASAQIKGERKANKATALHFFWRLHNREERANTCGSIRGGCRLGRAARELLAALVAGADCDTIATAVLSLLSLLSLSRLAAARKVWHETCNTSILNSSTSGRIGAAESPTYQPLGGGLSGGAAPPPPKRWRRGARLRSNVPRRAGPFEISTGPTTPSLRGLFYYLLNGCTDAPTNKRRN